MMRSTAALVNDGGAGCFDPGVFVNSHCKQLTKTPGSKRPAPPLFIFMIHNVHSHNNYIYRHNNFNCQLH